MARARREPEPEPKTKPAPAGYSGTPLPRKLGLREGTVLALRGAPARFEDTLGPLSAGAAVTRSARARRDLTLWFVRSRAELERGLAGMLAVVASGRLWLAWPKKTSGVATDLTENVLREIVLPTGWVDIKVCAIDATWSGLLFARRRTPPKGERDA